MTDQTDICPKGPTGKHKFGWFVEDNETRCEFCGQPEPKNPPKQVSERRGLVGDAAIPDSPPPLQESLEQQPFVDPRDLPKMKLADGTEVKLKAGPWKKSRIGLRFNGKHRD